LGGAQRWLAAKLTPASCEHKRWSQTLVANTGRKHYRQKLEPSPSVMGFSLPHTPLRLFTNYMRGLFYLPRAHLYSAKSLLLKYCLMSALFLQSSGREGSNHFALGRINNKNEIAAQQKLRNF
jgi:hypothetical protein